MVSDFFLPQLGGVEVHIYELAKQLVMRGHKAIVVTHKYGDTVGVRWLEPGVKVYYIPFFSFSFNTIIPTFLLTLPLARDILLRQQIQLVHTHQASSVLAFEFSHHAKMLGLKTVHTQHSLFGFSDLTSFNLNKVAQMSYFNCDRIICVSRTTQQNLMMRMNMKEDMDLYVTIPNSVDATNFVRKPPKLKRDVVKLITVGRLFYRKGTDFLVEIIPKLFERYHNIEWTFIGDGPKKYLLDYLLKQHHLEGRLKLLGRVDHQKVQQYLRESDIFINPSLTQSFGIAIVQAAAIGLLCVSTDVGAVWEVLPKQFIMLAQPQSNSLLKAIQQSIETFTKDQFKLPELNVGEIYSWKKNVLRTEQVYRQALAKPILSRTDRLKELLKQNRFSYYLFIIVFLLCWVMHLVLDIVRPKHKLSKPIVINYHRISAQQQAARD